MRMRRNSLAFARPNMAIIDLKTEIQKVKELKDAGDITEDQYNDYVDKVMKRSVETAELTLDMYLAALREGVDLRGTPEQVMAALREKAKYPPRDKPKDDDEEIDVERSGARKPGARKGDTRADRIERLREKVARERVDERGLGTSLKKPSSDMIPNNVEKSKDAGDRMVFPYFGYRQLIRTLGYPYTVGRLDKESVSRAYERWRAEEIQHMAQVGWTEEQLKKRGLLSYYTFLFKRLLDIPRDKNDLSKGKGLFQHTLLEIIKNLETRQLYVWGAKGKHIDEEKLKQARQIFEDITGATVPMRFRQDVLAKEGITMAQYASKAEQAKADYEKQEEEEYQRYAQRDEREINNADADKEARERAAHEKAIRADLETDVG